MRKWCEFFWPIAWRSSAKPVTFGKLKLKTPYICCLQLAGVLNYIDIKIKLFCCISFQFGVLHMVSELFRLFFRLNLSSKG